MGGPACAGGASTVRATCWLASEGEPSTPPLDGEDLVLADPVPLHP